MQTPLGVGAERGALVLDHDGELCISARGFVDHGGTAVDVPAARLMRRGGSRR